MAGGSTTVCRRFGLSFNSLSSEEFALSLCTSRGSGFRDGGQHLFHDPRLQQLSSWLGRLLDKEGFHDGDQTVSKTGSQFQLVARSVYHPALWTVLPSAGFDKGAGVVMGNSNNEDVKPLIARTFRRDNLIHDILAVQGYPHHDDFFDLPSVRWLPRVRTRLCTMPRRRWTARPGSDRTIGARRGQSR